jgi:hypothetical protein
VCQRHLRRAAEAHDEIEQQGASVVVFFNADLDLVEDWHKGAGHMPADYLVVADPDAEVFESLGTIRQNPVSLMTKAIGGGIKSAREGIFPKPTRADVLRLGADAAVDAHGNILLLHLADSADDRLPIADLIDAINGDGA